MSVVDSIVSACEAAGAIAGREQLFRFGAYGELRREHAVRLTELVKNENLLTRLGKVFQQYNLQIIKPTDLRIALNTFIQQNPKAKYTDKFTEDTFCRYVAVQLQVMPAHIRRMTTSDKKRAEAFSKVTQEVHKKGTRILDAFAVVVGDKAPTKRKITKSDSWPDCSALMVPTLPKRGKPAEKEPAEADDDDNDDKGEEPDDDDDIRDYSDEDDFHKRSEEEEEEEQASEEIEESDKMKPCAADDADEVSPLKIKFLGKIELQSEDEAAPPPARAKARRAKASSSAAITDALRRAEVDAKKQSSAPIPAARGAQKQAAKEVKAAMTKTDKETHVHPVLGKLTMGVGPNKSDLLFRREGEKGTKLLISASTRQAEQTNTGMSHREFITELRQIAIEHALDKPNLKKFRDEWLELGHRPW